MKIYRANQELEKVLLRHGFIETTPEKEKKKGKKDLKNSNPHEKKYTSII